MKFILLVSAFIAVSIASLANKKPNVIIIITDDSGYSDFSCYGNKDWQTPHVDQIAKSGVRFTDGYVTESVCSPSRAGLLTGRYQQRFGHEMNLISKPAKGNDAEYLGLPITETLLPVYFKEAGYKTAAIGKWHLGERPQFHPNKRGFDHFFGMLGGGAAYFEEKRRKNDIQRNGKPVHNLPYLTEAIGNEAVDFISKNKQQPFFMYLSFNAVHGPLMAKKEDHDKLGHIQFDRRRAYGAMHLSLDRQIGRVMELLRKEGIEENTLVFFINDNGGPLDLGALNGNLRGRKGTCMEGGIRVPYMIQWPGHIKPNTVYKKPVSALDIFATSLSAIGYDISKLKLDGVNLLPYLNGEKRELPHEKLYWRRHYYAAIRKGDWKLVRLRDRAPMLFNLKKDQNERKDLAKRQTKKVDELMKDLFEWETEMSYPLWWTAPRFMKENTKQHDQYEISKNLRRKPIYIK